MRQVGKEHTILCYVDPNNRREWKNIQNLIIVGIGIAGFRKMSKSTYRRIKGWKKNVSLNLNLPVRNVVFFKCNVYYYVPVSLTNGIESI